MGSCFNRVTVNAGVALTENAVQKSWTTVTSNPKYRRIKRERQNTPKEFQLPQSETEEVVAKKEKQLLHIQ